MNLTVYTVILNHFDHLRPPVVVNPDVRYICFADQPMPDVPPWKIQPCPVLTGSPARDSRIPKMLPHLLLDTEYSIYHDGCFRMQCDPVDLLARRLNGFDLSMYRHPCRECIYEEAKACIAMSEDAVRRGFPETPPIEPILQQMKRYRAMGHPEYYGLWAGGVVIRRHTDMMARLGDEWWQGFQEGSTRDQLAFPPVLRGLGCRINTMPGDILQVKDFGFHWHAAFRESGDNPTFNDERDRRLARWERLNTLVTIPELRLRIERGWTEYNKMLEAATCKT